ncbi:MAG TPA: ABC transporter permease [Lacipirellulaceae bacterium]|jgi:ABC-type transport system involved in multi-copper enzyme maturation permease subunit|nr:ABC transporter permease [Lacipirellulaceae bacterium]
MVLEQELLPFLSWLLGYPWSEPHAFLQSAVFRFALTGLVLAILALVFGFLVALVRHGPLKAGDITYRVVVNGFSELFKTSPRRVWAIARLAIKESVRRRVIVALVIYVIILLFAGWFLQTGYREPGKLFFSVVLTATTYLVLLIALLVSAFSLPNDFKSKTIYTVVTKPVRSGDIVLGRILGFTIVGTILLAAMAVCSGVFVWRMLDHTHAINIESLENVYDANGKVVMKKGHTTTNMQHSHEVEIYPDTNTGLALSTNGHEHAITVKNVNGETVYEVSGPQGLMRARVPYYGKLRYLDRKGVDAPKGISVGSEWTYRSFIEGGTPAAAIWTFSGINENSFRKDHDAEILPLELVVRVFRTYKGNIDNGIQGILQLRNPDNKAIKSEPWTFTAKDSSINSFDWSRKLNDADQKPIDLLKDLVSKDGQLEVVVQCLDHAQYYGFAQPDCYIRLPDGSPLWNFVKAQASIWIQMVLVIAIGVTCSTLVNAPVAMLFTISFITLGFFRQFFVDVAVGKQVGGGPLESLYRIVTQMNQVSPLPESFGTHLIQSIDSVLKLAMTSLAYILPDFRSFSTVSYVAYGYNIPMNQLEQDLLVCFAYLLGLFILGYFFLRTREVAK